MRTGAILAALATAGLVSGARAQRPAEPAVAHAGPVAAVAWLPDGRLASASPAALVVAVPDAEDAAAAPWAGGPSWRITCLRAGGTAAAPWLVAGGGRPARGGMVGEHTAQPPSWSVRRIAGDQVYAVDRLPRRSLLAAGLADGSVQLVAPAGDAPVRTVHAHTAAVRALAFAPDSTLLVSGGLDGALIFSDVADPAAPRRIAVVQDHTAGVECLGWIGHGVLSGARDGKVRLHRRDGRLLRTWQRLGARVLAVAGDRRGGAWIGLADGTLLHLADATSPDPPAAEERFSSPVFALAADASGRRLAVGLRGGYRVLEVAGRR